VLGRDGDTMMRKVVEYLGLLQVQTAIGSVLNLHCWDDVVVEEEIFLVPSFHVMAKI